MTTGFVLWDWFLERPIHFFVGNRINEPLKAIAFAGDLTVLTRGVTVVEAENYMNIEMKKIMEWATNNRLLFNENKSQNYAYVS